MKKTTEIIKDRGKDFDNQFNHNEPKGKAIALFISNSDGSRSQAPAQALVKSHINQTTKLILSSLVEEIEELDNFDISNSGNNSPKVWKFEGYEVARKEVIQIIQEIIKDIN